LISPNGERAKLVKAPLPHHPKTCLVTGRTDAELVDLGADYQCHACAQPTRIYIRRGTFEAVAQNLLGMVVPSKLREAEREVKRLEKDNAELLKVIEASEQIDAGLKILQEASA
jgi:hypothetical protein